MNKKVFSCVLVTYNPDFLYLKKVISTILLNKIHVYVIDNGSNDTFELINSVIGCELILLNENVGIARAQNIGITKAFENNADYVWLSDQDTIYPIDYVASMGRILSEMEENNICFGALGPSFYEVNRNRVEGFVKFSPWEVRFSPEKGLNKVAHLIASGMVISKHAFEAIGCKREDLFIDWVDLEWCWRANAKGYQIYGTGDVRIEHSLGDVMVNVVSKQISIRSPFRHYFIIRNGMYLCLHSRFLPLGARIHYLVLTLATSVAYPILAPSQKWQHLKVNALGLWHGIIGRLGPKP
jgi:rhamnosyltransferase